MARRFELEEKFLPVQESELDRLANEAQRGLQNMESNTETLLQYSSKLGTEQDNKSFRAKLKNKVNDTSEDVAKTFLLLQQIDRLKLATLKERDDRDKLSRRMLDKFGVVKNKFEAILKKITSSERMFLDNARRSTIHNHDPNRDSMGDGDNFQEQQLQEINVTHEVIEEREKDVKKFREVLTLMNDIARKQAEEVRFQGEQLDVVVGNIQSSKGNVQGANKHLKDAVQMTDSNNRTNMYACFIIAIVCAVVVMIYMAN
jgi:t-SNARE complex subunit (syntaxin)